MISDMTSNAHQFISCPESGRESDRHRILIIDDEPAILFAYRKLIEKEGMYVDSCTCLDGAVRHIRERQYLAVITDVRLAGTCNEDGLEFLRILREVHPATKMILATGHGSSDIEKTARNMGVSHYFEKPVLPALIMGALRGFCHQA